ncbi:flagellar hook-associated protein 1 [Caldalkalibacillus thermarum]|uniref:flagellar hook-associated protein FlgK n=1 Tax=Caldalkalibacillus thermarum TaxID=296745 RepID=UPI00166ECC37|nr:flagellar hook-associated protein FlgK [Caldalkalibacillus thermarum]GGK23913.1 flagellar hook-associated protein 1 [Caldalkalibacillus thermarum]
MRSTFHGLETAKRGLYAQQTGINTTAHNIANANTKGYTRQRVNFTASAPIEVPALNRSVAPGQLGTGVNFSSIVRLREKFLDDQYRNEASSYGYWHVQKDALEKIELIFNEPSENGLRSTIDQFWNAWSDLSREPENLTARAVVRERAQAMLDAFQYAETKLKELQKDLEVSFEVKRIEANTYIQHIAQLNKEIRRIEGMGMNANDLRDQRDVLVDELARLVAIKVEEDSQGMYTITLQRSGSEDIKLVEGIAYYTIGEDDSGNAAGIVELSAVQENGLSGELHSLWKAENEIVQGYLNELRAMFFTLVYGEVEITVPADSALYDPENHTLVEYKAGDKITVNGINGLHQLGWTLREENGNAIGGPPLFVLADGTDFENISFEDFRIANVRLNPDIAHNAGLIAASARVEIVDGQLKVLKGNGNLALMMSQLRDQAFNIGGEPGTVDDYYRSLLGKLGVQTQKASRQASNQKIIMEAVDNRRQSVSGVSLDEEMVNLVQLQHAYNASARMVTAVDQMLDTIINRMGIVGR